MHPFCHELKTCVPEILNDAFAANAVGAGFDEILAAEATWTDPGDVVERVLDTVLRHPALRPRFQRFVATNQTRGGETPPQTPLPSLQELFDMLRLVKNAIVLARPVTDDDVALACLVPSTAENTFADPGQNAAGGVQ